MVNSSVVLMAPTSITESGRCAGARLESRRSSTGEGSGEVAICAGGDSLATGLAGCTGEAGPGDLAGDEFALEPPNELNPELSNSAL